MRTVLLLLAPCMLWAQGEAVSARLAGAVTDPADAVVPHASLTLSNPASGVAREFVTGVDGKYAFSLLPPGVYQLKVEKEGFATYLQSNLVLAVAQSSILNPKLALGSLAQAVEVIGDAPLLQTGHANIGTEVSRKQAIELPLNLRNVFNLALLSSGVHNQLEYQAFT